MTSINESGTFKPTDPATRRQKCSFSLNCSKRRLDVFTICVEGALPQGSA